MEISFEPKHYKIFHYYFFSLGMFSFINILLFIFLLSTSSTILLFISFFLFNFFLSWYISWGIFYRELREIFVLKFFKSLISYILLILLSLGFALLFWYSFSFSISAIVLSITTINLFIFIFSLTFILLKELGKF